MKPYIPQSYKTTAVCDIRTTEAGVKKKMCTCSGCSGRREYGKNPKHMVRVLKKRRRQAEKRLIATALIND